jgi:hypothetical protein
VVVVEKQTLVLQTKMVDQHLEETQHFHKILELETLQELQLNQHLLLEGLVTEVVAV